MQTVKSYRISKQTALDSFKEVKDNRDSMGVDRETIKDFEQDLEGNLYKILNRMSSGRYSIFIFYTHKHGVSRVKIKLEPRDAYEEEKGDLSLLTESEKEVAILKLQGKTNQAIAEIRNVSLTTVKSQINDIYKKLNIKNISELKRMK
jgi:DNA-binding NarL/FixJ family response regulator